MTSQSDPLSFEGEAPAIAAELVQAFEAMGVTASAQFKVVGACASLSEPCPHTGAWDCHCQLSMLSIQGFPLSSAAVIRIHSMDGHAMISIDQAETVEDARLLKTVVEAALAC